MFRNQISNKDISAIMPKTVILTKDLAALAFAVKRINNGVFHEGVVYDAEQDSMRTVIPNKVVMRRAIEELEDTVTVTDEDRELADTAIQLLIQSRTMALLKGKRITDFINSLCNLFEKGKASSSDCGLASFLPMIYELKVKEQQKEEQTSNLAFTSQYIGNVGDKVKFTLNVISSRFVQRFNCYSVLGDDGNGNLIGFFTAKQDCTASGTYTAKVKRTERDSYHQNACVTTVNFVKHV